MLAVFAFLTRSWEEGGITLVALAPDDLCLRPKNKVFSTLGADLHGIAIGFDDLVVFRVVTVVSVVDLQVGGK